MLSDDAYGLYPMALLETTRGKYMDKVKSTGTRQEVLSGVALKTKGGLTASDFIVKPSGAIVSKKRSEAGRIASERLRAYREQRDGELEAARDGGGCTELERVERPREQSVIRESESGPDPTPETIKPKRRKAK